VTFCTSAFAFLFFGKTIAFQRDTFYLQLSPFYSAPAPIIKHASREIATATVHRSKMIDHGQNAAA
jgi:hypothetical protein